MSRFASGGATVLTGTRAPWASARRALLLLLLAVSAAGQASAQDTGTITGMVLASGTQAPLNGAEVLIAALNRSSVTDAAGGFRLSNLPAGAHRVLIRAIGFEPLEYDTVVRAGDSTQIRVTMNLSSVRLPMVTVEERGRAMRPALQALAERKRIGLGAIYDGADLEEFRGRTLVDLLRRHVTVRGSTLYSRRGPFSLSELDCPIQVIWDGMLVSRFNLRIDAPELESLGGIEFYAGGATVPPEFNRGDGRCGVLVLWTRDRF